MLLVVPGLHQLGWITVPFLNCTRRADMATAYSHSLASSFLIGVSFGTGWSPCVEPILGAMLTMEAGQGSLTEATWLLTACSLGMAIPYLLPTIAVGTTLAIIRQLNHRLSLVTSMSGAVLIDVGLIMVLGNFENIFIEIVRVAPWVPCEPEL